MTKQDSRGKKMMESMQAHNHAHHHGNNSIVPLSQLHLHILGTTCVVHVPTGGGGDGGGGGGGLYLVLWVEGPNSFLSPWRGGLYM